MANQPISAEKYIRSRARTLPVFKCFVTESWQSRKIAPVLVARRHVTGNLTFGIYLVDLLCLGIKDTLVFFNEPEEKLDEILSDDANIWIEADYNLVHNIVYAGYEFALEFDIAPHKKFEISKFILEEDDDRIPLIEVEVGDENGDPCLVVSPGFSYLPIIKKLEQHAGKDNYSVEFAGGAESDADNYDDDDINDDPYSLDKIEDGYLDFEHIAETGEEDLKEIVTEQNRSSFDLQTIMSELLLRQLNKTEAGAIIKPDELSRTKECRVYENGLVQWQSQYQEIQDEIEAVFPRLQQMAGNPENLEKEVLLENYLKLIDSYKDKENMGFVIFNAISLPLIIEFTSYLLEKLDRFNADVQLLIACYAALQQISSDNLSILNSVGEVSMAYPYNKTIHGLHSKLFWLYKAIRSIHDGDKEKILFYHNLLRISGTPGTLRILYVIQLNNWLKEQLGLDEVEDQLDLEENLDENIEE